MHSKLNCYELKIDYYKMFYISLMVTTEQKFTVDIKKIKRKESKNIITENHQITKEEGKKDAKEL